MELEEEKIPTVHVGDGVTYVDQTWKPRPAIVTAVWEASGPTTQPMINVAIVSNDPGQNDGHGRQVRRETSVPHERDKRGNGHYWIAATNVHDLSNAHLAQQTPAA